MEILRWGSVNDEKYLAVGLGDETTVHLLSVPSFETIYIFSKSSELLPVTIIYQLFEGNSFMCCYSCGTLVRWYLQDDSKSKKTVLKHQVFQERHKRICCVLDIIQMRYDTRKLVTYTNSEVGIWDLNTATRLHLLTKELVFWSLQMFFELGNTGMFVAPYGQKIIDVREECRSMADIEEVFIKGLSLNNDHVLLLRQRKKKTYIEEYQVIRYVTETNNS